MNVQALIEIFNIKENKLTSKEKLVILGTVTVLIFSSILMLTPSIAKIGKEIIDNKEKQEELDALTKKVNILQDLKDGSREASFTTYVKNAEKYLPPQKPSLQTLLYLNRLAREEKVTMSGFSLNPGAIKTAEQEEDQPVVSTKPEAVIDPEVSDFDVEFSLTGDKEEVLSFVENVGKISPMMKIEQFGLSDVEAPGGIKTDIIKVELRIKVFYIHIDKHYPPVNSQLNLLTSAEEDVLKSLSNQLYINESNNYPLQVRDISKLGKPNPFD